MQHWLKNDKQINLCTINATFSGQYAGKNDILPYSCKQTFGKALQKLENALPANLERKNMLIKAIRDMSGPWKEKKIKRKALKQLMKR